MPVITRRLVPLTRAFVILLKLKLPPIVHVVAVPIVVVELLIVTFPFTVIFLLFVASSKVPAPELRVKLPFI